MLLTRSGCSLCDAARGIVAVVAEERGLRWHETPLDAAASRLPEQQRVELADEYGDRLPVLLLDGVEHAYWTVDRGRLLAALDGRRVW